MNIKLKTHTETHSQLFFDSALQRLIIIMFISDNSFSVKLTFTCHLTNLFIKRETLTSVVKINGEISYSEVE